MGTILALLCLGYILLMYDLPLRIAYALDGGASRTRFNRVQASGLRALIAIVKTYVGFRIIIEKGITEKLPDQFMILSNHQSLVDIPVLAYAFPGRTVGFVAKKELGRGLPSLSFTLRKGRHALISRSGDFRAARKELVKLARRAKDGVCPAIFPEGTRSRTGDVGKFHSAAVRTILDQTRMPILSVAVDGGSRIDRFKGLVMNLKNSVYRVKLMSLYPPATQRAKIQEILNTSREEIYRQVEQWRNSRQT